MAIFPSDPYPTPPALDPGHPSPPDHTETPTPREPPDAPGTRPPLDLLGMWVQVVLIQMGIERRRKAAAEKSEPGKENRK